SNRGAGILLERPADIVPTIKSLLNDSTRYLDLRAAAAELATPNATELIIREIAALMPPAKAEAPVSVAA
ncbi:MAG: hypothetical protein QUS14_00695, partial [Pyrinomonadaceae bacterium]|nr:hypothetical protein [Pyrinomonadaceae bacterium]